jgi:NADH-quinone oxidoreductase subunit M
MSLWDWPWLECAIAVPVLGALCVGRVRDPIRAFRWGVIITGAALAAAVLAWIGFSLQGPAMGRSWGLQSSIFGRERLAVDELSAPLVVLVALLHFLTALATARTKMRRFSLAWSLTSESIRLATFACNEPWLLIGLLIAGTVTPYVELVNRGKPTRVYVLHMLLFAGLLILGYAFVDSAGTHQELTALATIPLLLAVLVRCGTVPAHCWVTDWFEHASFGNSLLFVAPLTGVYAAVRLVLPVAPDWVLEGIGLISLVTAVYAACMACVQRETRRFFAYLFLSHASLVLVGLELVTPVSLTGALSLWISVALSLGGLALTLRALEARFGRLSLATFHGLYEHSPMLAMCFLLTGLASVGFPGTMGYVATELLVDGAVGANPFAGLAIVVAAAVNGIAVVRAYLLLFTGARRASTVSLRVGPRERFAVLTLMGLLLIGGIFPQWSVASRHRAAEQILHDREQHLSAPDGGLPLPGRSGG